MYNENFLIFFSRETVFQYDYLSDDEVCKVIYTLDNTLDDDPKYGVFNFDQTKFIVNSSQDILYVDIKAGLEIDLDEREGISLILSIIKSNDD